MADSKSTLADAADEDDGGQRKRKTRTSPSLAQSSIFQLEAALACRSCFKRMSLTFSWPVNCDGRFGALKLWIDGSDIKMASRSLHRATDIYLGQERRSKQGGVLVLTCSASVAGTTLSGGQSDRPDSMPSSLAPFAGGDCHCSEPDANRSGGFAQERAVPLFVARQK
jgi:hypothetical protein